MNKLIFQCTNVVKRYHDGTAQVDVLKKVNLSVEHGERIAIVGPSGSGKSTLLHVLGGLDNPSEGQIQIDGRDWISLSEKQRCEMRNKKLGFIYQFHHLLPEFTALENVMMPLLLGNHSIVSSNKQAEEILDKVGLSHRLTHKPAQLSGGERQRVAIARALVHKPQCVLADEPTGNLDQTTAAKVFQLMMELNEDLNTALIIVTHDQRLAAKMDKILSIENGKLI